jgi:hypothetical protein
VGAQSLELRRREFSLVEKELQQLGLARSIRLDEFLNRSIRSRLAEGEGRDGASQALEGRLDRLGRWPVRPFVELEMFGEANGPFSGGSSPMDRSLDRNLDVATARRHDEPTEVVVRKKVRSE